MMEVSTETLAFRVARKDSRKDNDGQGGLKDVGTPGDSQVAIVVRRGAVQNWGANRSRVGKPVWDR